MRKWEPLVSMNCLVPCSKLTVTSGISCGEDVLVSIAGLSEAEINMFCRGIDATKKCVKLSIFGGQTAQQTVRVFSSICVAPIMNHAATGGLKYSLESSSHWMPLTSSDSMVPLGFCKKTIPIRPEEEWIYVEERKVWQRLSEPGASRRYYLEVSYFCAQHFIPYLLFSHCLQLCSFKTLRKLLSCGSTNLLIH